MEPLTPPHFRWLWPEYCGGPLFWGWWLYLRDRNDGSENDEGGWGWLRYVHELRPVREFLLSIGKAGVPEVTDYPHNANRFSTWFAAEYPNGIRVLVIPIPGDRNKVRYEAA